MRICEVIGKTAPLTPMAVGFCLSFFGPDNTVNKGFCLTWGQLQSQRAVTCVPITHARIIPVHHFCVACCCSSEDSCSWV